MQYVSKYHLLFLQKFKKMILKFMYNCKRPKIAKSMLFEKKKNLKDSHVPISKFTTELQWSRL